MKKRIALFLAAALTLSLAACSNAGSTPGSEEDHTIDKSTADAYVGVWASDHMRFMINKGGIGRYELLSADVFYDFAYEIRDEILVITITGSLTNYMASFELNDEGTILTILQNGLPRSHKEETEFIKQPSNSETGPDTLQDPETTPQPEAGIPVSSNGEWDEVLCSGDGYCLVKKEVDAYDGYKFMVGVVDGEGNWIQELTNTGTFAQNIQYRVTSSRNPTMKDSSCYMYLGEGVFLASPGVSVFSKDKEYRVGPWENFVAVNTGEFAVWECLFWNVIDNSQKEIKANKMSVFQDGYLLFFKGTSSIGGGNLCAMNTEFEVAELSCKYNPRNPVHDFPIYSEGLFFAHSEGLISYPGFYDIEGNLVIDLRKYDDMDLLYYTPHFENGQATIMFRNNGGSTFKGTIDKTGAFINEPEKVDLTGKKAAGGE